MKDRNDSNRQELKADLDNRLKGINERLGRNVDPAVGERSRKRNSQGMGLALRVASEFVSAILVGAAIGYGIDWLVGSSPWAMIFFLLMGFAAGVLNVMRSAEEFANPRGADGNEGS